MRLNKKIVYIILILIVIICGFIFIKLKIFEKSEQNEVKAEKTFGSKDYDKKEVKVQNADISENPFIGEMEIVYCDKNVLIFKDYYGLFVYSLKTNEIINSLDVKYINCSYSQGDNACQFKTYDEGKIVKLYSSYEEYYFVWEENKLYTRYDISEHIEDKKENLKVIEMTKEWKEVYSCAFNYAEYDGDILYLTYSDEGNVKNLMYIIKNETGEVSHSNYIFR